MGLVLATQAALVLSETIARDRATHLERALESNREIGVAMGILMRQHELTREQAFDLLRVASQDTNRKLVDVATEVADTGVLTIRRRAGAS
jgi:AmiR/NasT family two-component response regulator